MGAAPHDAHAHGHDHADGHAHAHQHDGHSHAHAPASFDRAFAIGVGLNLAFVVAEVLFGLRTHSLALIADAGHNLGDVLGLVLAWAGVVLARRQPTPRRTYGMRRFSILAAIANAGILLIAVGAIIVEALERLRHPAPIAGGLVSVVAGIGIVINLGTALAFMRGREHDLNIRGAFLHMLADGLSSVGVLGAGAVVYFTGWVRADPLIAAGISLLILAWCFTLVRDSGRILLESVPKHMKLEEIEAAMKAVDGVLEVHDLHVWTITSRMYALTAHVRLREDLPVSQTEEICGRLKKLLDERWEINHATLQFEVAPGEALACEQRGSCAETGNPAGHGHAH